MERVAKNREQVKADFERHGKTIDAWAKENGFSRSAVARVLAGKSLNRYGKSHRIAIMLGMKDGEIDGV